MSALAKWDFPYKAKEFTTQHVRLPICQVIMIMIYLIPVMVFAEWNYSTSKITTYLQALYDYTTKLTNFLKYLHLEILPVYSNCEKSTVPIVVIKWCQRVIHILLKYATDTSCSTTVHFLVSLNHKIFCQREVLWISWKYKQLYYDPHHLPNLSQYFWHMLV